MLNPEELKPNEYNPIEMDSETERTLEKSIKELGFFVPVLVNADNVIIDGEHRWRVALKQGVKRIPVIRLSVPESNKLENMDRNLRSNLIKGYVNEDKLSKIFSAMLKKITPREIAERYNINISKIIALLDKEKRFEKIKFDDLKYEEDFDNNVTITEDTMLFAVSLPVRIHQELYKVFNFITDNMKNIEKFEDLFPELTYLKEKKPNTAELFYLAVQLYAFRVYNYKTKPVAPAMEEGRKRAIQAECLRVNIPIMHFEEFRKKLTKAKISYRQFVQEFVNWIISKKSNGEKEEKQL